MVIFVLLFLAVLDTTMIVVMIQATEWKFCINFILGLRLISVVTGCGNYITNLLFRNFRGNINNIEILCGRIPLGLLNTFCVKCSLDACFAHAAVTVDF